MRLPAVLEEDPQRDGEAGLARAAALVEGHAARVVAAAQRAAVGQQVRERPLATRAARRVDQGLPVAVAGVHAPAAAHGAVDAAGAALAAGAAQQVGAAAAREASEARAGLAAAQQRDAGAVAHLHAADAATLEGLAALLANGENEQKLPQLLLSSKRVVEVTPEISSQITQPLEGPFSAVSNPTSAIIEN